MDKVEGLAFEGGAQVGFMDGFTEGEGEDLPKLVAGVFDVADGAAVLLGDGRIPLTLEHAFKDGSLEVGEVFASLLVDDVVNWVQYFLPIHT